MARLALKSKYALLIQNLKGEWSPALLFVWTVLRDDRRSLYFALAGCGISVLVATFQFAVFTSFLKTAQVPVEVVGADAWVMAKGVKAFDFPYPISTDYATLVMRCFPEASTRRVVFGFATWRAPSGDRGNVAVVGYDGAPAKYKSFISDRADEGSLHSKVGDEAEIGGISFHHQSYLDRLRTFLGAPYVVTSFHGAASALNYPSERVSFVAVDIPTGSAPELKKMVFCAQSLSTDITVMTDREFKMSSSLYWLLKTGAGAAVLLASLLATVLNVVILVNSIGRFALRHHDSMMSLIGHGGNSTLLVLVLRLIAIVFAVGGAIISAVMLPVADAATQGFVPWVTVGAIDYLFLFVVLLLGCGIGLTTTGSTVRSMNISEIFRV